MKLMEDNRRLSRENEELREQIQTTAKKRNKAVDVPNPVKEEEAIQ
jgi:regulator of replication initiation timing